MAERLTERHGKYINVQPKEEIMCSNYCTSCGKADCDHIRMALEKLAHYEDLEEQGRLIIPPCKIGDTVYVIPSKVNYMLNIVNHYEENNRVYEQVVHSIQMFSNIRYILYTCDGLNGLSSDFYKETWFLTREEAEMAETALKAEAEAALKGCDNK